MFLWGAACTAPKCAGNPRYKGTTGRDTGTSDSISFVSERLIGTIWEDSFAVQGVPGAVMKQPIRELGPGRIQRQNEQSAAVPISFY